MPLLRTLLLLPDGAMDPAHKHPQLTRRSEHTQRMSLQRCRGWGGMLPLSRGIAAFGALLPLLLPSQWGQVEIVVRPQENVDAASSRRVGVQDLFAVAQEHT